MIRSSRRTASGPFRATFTPLLVLAIAIPLATADPARSHEAPTPVSPGDTLHELETDRRCPVFTWASDGRSSHALRLEVHRLSDGERELVLSRPLPSHMSRFSPAGSDCLVAGERYEWSLVSSLDGLEAARSRPSRFKIRRGPSEAELDAALSVLRSPSVREPDPFSVSAPSTELTIVERRGPERVDRQDRPKKRSRVQSAATSTGVSIAGDGTMVAQSYVAVVTPQFLTDVTAADLSCSGCVDFADLDRTALQTSTFVDCGPDGWLAQLNSAVCEEDSPSELTEESTLSPVDGQAKSAGLGGWNPGYALCALTRVEFQEIEGSSERARCDVDREIITSFGVRWLLLATTTDGADAHCAARCFR